MRVVFTRRGLLHCLRYFVYAAFLMITEGLYLRHKQREQLKYENERDYLEIGRDPVKERLLLEYVGKVKVPYPSQ